MLLHFFLNATLAQCGRLFASSIDMSSAEGE
jgi:hypothetical protein